MKLSLNVVLNLVCTGSLILMLPVQAFSLDCSFTSQNKQRLQQTEADERKIKDTARQITVKIFWGDSIGSGILIDEQDLNHDGQPRYLYLVLTNNHVIGKTQSEYSIETPDGRVHRAFSYKEANAKFGDNDLGLIWFNSSVRYGKAEISDVSTLNNENKVYVGGFPCGGRLCEKITEFKLTSGAVLLLDKPLIKGYQVGYTNETSQGTSGGPVLNNKGQLVAINGRTKYSTISSEYNYIDGTSPPTEVLKYMKYFSWGIPINTYKKLAPQKPFDKLLNLTSVATPNSSNNTSSPTPEAKNNSVTEIDKRKYLIAGLVLGIGLIVFFILGFLFCLLYSRFRKPKDKIKIS